MRVLFSLFSLLMLVSQVTVGAIKSEPFIYKEMETIYEGYIAYDDSAKKLPGMMIVHDWMGPSEFTKQKAEQLAKDGYFAFAVDVYGQNTRPQNNKQAGVAAGQFTEDRQAFRKVMQHAHRQLLQFEQVKPDSVFAIGYCFGGTAVLELARSGANLKAVTSFHGGLSNPNPEDAARIKAKVLVLHGAADPLVDQQELASFKEEMAKAKVDFKVIEYPGAVHAFTNPKAGDDPSKGVAYNAKADKQSWQDFQGFMRQFR